MKTLNDLKVLTLDTETYDPHLTGGGGFEKLGPGWRFKMHNKDFPFEVLLVGMITHDGRELTTIDKGVIGHLIEEHDAIVMHNAAYDIGALLTLFGFEYEDVLRRKLMLDTVIMAKCEDNTVTGLEKVRLGKDAYSKVTKRRYSLDYLSSKYTNLKKSHGDLFTLFYDESDCFIKAKQRAAKTERSKTKTDWKKPTPGLKSGEYERLVYTNGKLIMEECPGKFEEYCLNDCRATKALMQALSKSFACGLPVYMVDDNRISWEDYSNCILAFTVRSGKGIKVDLNALRDTVLDFDSKLFDLQNKVNTFFNKEVLLTSPKQIIEALESISVKVPILENSKKEMAKSVSSEALEIMLEDEEGNDKILAVIRDIASFRTLKQLRGLYFEAILKQNKYLGYDGDWGRVVFEIKPLGAVQTGRCTSSNLNIQQVPKRNPESAKLCRGILYPDDGYRWGSCDFSNQEPRLMIHWASKLDAPGVSDIVQQYIDDPNTSIHTIVAEKVQKSKAETKPVTLGLMYGMGEMKLCLTLGYPTTIMYNKWQGKEMKVAGPEGKRFLEGYHRMLPFLKFTISAFENSFEKNKYLKLISGRVIKLENTYDVRKAFSKGIQGGSADWTLMAISRCYAAGLEVLNAVHDEINIQYKTDDEVNKLKQIMETTLTLDIPIVAELTTGVSWGDSL